MIELPEAVTIARQISSDLKGKQIECAIRGNTPHKFAFYTHSSEAYATLLKGKTIGEAAANGSLILVHTEPAYRLVLGGGGERILCHDSAAKVPKKHQLLLHFTDGAYLSVSVQGWGFAQLLHESEVAANPHAGKQAISPLSDAFTFDYFQALFAGLAEQDARSVKFFMISEPSIHGVGNGYLQDILFCAKLHPRRRAIDLTDKERHTLYTAIRGTLAQAVALGGRDTERDLYNQPGDYRKMLDSRAVGLPCPDCGTAIAKSQYLGGAIYFCPKCQMLPS